MPRLEAALDLPHVADPGDRALVEQRVADRARRVVLAQAAQEALRVELGRQNVRAEPAEALVEARARLGHQLEHRSVELHDRSLAAPQHQPGGARRRAGAPSSTRQAPRHAQVRVHRQVALEADEQVLAVGIDRRHGAARKPLLPARPAEARMWRAQLIGHVAREHGPDAVRRVVDRVALGHLCEGTARFTALNASGRSADYTCVGTRVSLLGKFNGLSLLSMIVLALVIGTVLQARIETRALRGAEQLTNAIGQLDGGSAADARAACAPTLAAEDR